MVELKTQANDSSVQSYLDAIDDESRREDCRAILEIMRRVTGEEPRMWGTGIVGFGSYHYKYESGREGDSCLVGFSSRKGDISVYITAGFDSRESLLADLGKYKTGKACLYIKRMADIKAPVLEKLISDSVADRRRRYPQ